MAKTSKATQPPKATLPEPEHLTWTLATALCAFVVREGYRFGAMLQQSGREWSVIGVATPEDGSSASDPLTRVDQILAQHAHENLGMYPTLAEATEVAEHYAWFANVPTDHCDCKETHS